jgi:hypothetical protein
MTDYNPNNMFKFEELISDVCEDFGNTSLQARNRAKRMINRGLERIIGHGKRWTWTRVMGEILTSDGEEFYSLEDDCRKPFFFRRTGTNRGKMTCIPDSEFYEAVPDTEDTSGVPEMWSPDGVDSNGAYQVRFYPIPDGEYTVKYKYERGIIPLRNDADDVRAVSGLPGHMREVLLKMSSALMFKGIDDARYNDDMAEAVAMVNAAYADDQENADREIRAPARSNVDQMDDSWPRLPSNFSR